MGVTSEFLSERDRQIYELRKTGMSHEDIAQKLELTLGSVASSIDRHLKKLNSKAYLSYPEVLRMELERLDQLQQALWPFTQFHSKTLDDGTEIVLEPDERKIATVLAIMDRRAKLLGMDKQVVDINMVGQIDVRSSLEGSNQIELSRESESLQLLDAFAETGVLDADVIAALRAKLRPAELEVVDAEVVDEAS